jgi:hypothetical protein
VATATRSRVTNPATGATICQFNEGDEADSAVEMIVLSEAIEESTAGDHPGEPTIADGTVSPEDTAGSGGVSADSGEPTIVDCTVSPEYTVTLLYGRFLIEGHPDAGGTELRIEMHHGVLRAPLLVSRLSDRHEVDLGHE